MTDDLSGYDLAVNAEALVHLLTLDGHLAVRSGEPRDVLLKAEAASPHASLHRVSTALTDVQTLRFEIRDFLVHERLLRLESLQRGLVGLRRVQEPDALIDQVCRTAVECCGFDRVMLSKVEGSVWKPWKSHAVEDSADDGPFRRWISGMPTISLRRLLLESEMVRRRETLLVTDVTPEAGVARDLARCQV